MSTVTFQDLVILLGVGSPPEFHDLLKEIPVALGNLAEFIDESIQNHIYQYGSVDLFISDRDHTVMFQFCHEGDIHCRSKDNSIIQEIKDRWIASGFSGDQEVGGQFVPWTSL